MLTARPTPSPPPTTQWWGLSSVLRTPHFSSWRCLSSRPSRLNLSLLTGPVLHALLQGSSKSCVSLFCRRLGAEFTSSQRYLCNPRVQGGQPSSRLRVERPIFYMKAGAGIDRCRWKEKCVCVPGRGSDWISALTYKTILTHVQTVIMLTQWMSHVHHWLHFSL